MVVTLGVQKRSDHLKNPPANTGRLGFDPWSGRSPRGGMAVQSAFFTQVQRLWVSGGPANLHGFARVGHKLATTSGKMQWIKVICSTFQSRAFYHVVQCSDNTSTPELPSRGCLGENYQSMGCELQVQGSIDLSLWSNGKRGTQRGSGLECPLSARKDRQLQTDRITHLCFACRTEPPQHSSSSRSRWNWLWV